MLPGDQVRVRYDPIAGSTNLAKDVQTLNITALLSESERQREGYAMSQPATEGPLMAESSSGEQASTMGETRSGTSSSESPAAGGMPEELPGTATPLPLMATAGILFLGLAIGAGVFFRRSAHNS